MFNGGRSLLCGFAQVAREGCDGVQQLPQWLLSLHVTHPQLEHVVVFDHVLDGNGQVLECFDDFMPLLVLFLLALIAIELR